MFIRSSFYAYSYNLLFYKWVVTCQIIIHFSYERTSVHLKFLFINVSNKYIYKSTVIMIINDYDYSHEDSLTNLNDLLYDCTERTFL